MIRTAQKYSFQKRQNLKKDGFTLIELLVVIALIIIIALTAFIVINPLELQKQGRDSVRVADLTAINQAIQSAVSEASGSASYPLCDGAAGACSGDSTQANARLNNGTGWVKVNMSNTSLKMPALKLDPSNTGSLKYQYATDGTDWELNAQLESNKYQGNMSNDGGNSATQYEVGTKLDLLN